MDCRQLRHRISRRIDRLHRLNQYLPNPFAFGNPLTSGSLPKLGIKFFRNQNLETVAHMSMLTCSHLL